MILTPVQSTTLATVAYDDLARQLWLIFRSHAVYCYFDVPPSMHDGLLAAPSKGAYFNQHIRGRFAFLKQPSTQMPPLPQIPS